MKKLIFILSMVMGVLISYAVDEYPERQFKYLSTLYHPQFISQQSLIAVFVDDHGSQKLRVLESDGLKFTVGNELVHIDALKEILLKIYSSNIHHTILPAESWIKGAAGLDVVVFPLVSPQSYPDSIGMAVFGLTPGEKAHFHTTRKRIELGLIPSVALRPAKYPGWY